MTDLGAASSSENSYVSASSAASSRSERSGEAAEYGAGVASVGPGKAGGPPRVLRMDTEDPDSVAGRTISKSMCAILVYEVTPIAGCDLVATRRVCTWGLRPERCARRTLIWDLPGLWLPPAGLLRLYIAGRESSACLYDTADAGQRRAAEFWLSQRGPLAALDLRLVVADGRQRRGAAASLADAEQRRAVEAAPLAYVATTVRLRLGA